MNKILSASLAAIMLSTAASASCSSMGFYTGAAISENFTHNKYVNDKKNRLKVRAKIGADLFVGYGGKINGTCKTFGVEFRAGSIFGKTNFKPNDTEEHTSLKTKYQFGLFALVGYEFTPGWEAGVVAGANATQYELKISEDKNSVAKKKVKFQPEAGLYVKAQLTDMFSLRLDGTYVFKAKVALPKADIAKVDHKITKYDTKGWKVRLAGIFNF